MYVGVDLVETYRFERIVKKYEESFFRLFVSRQEIDQFGHASNYVGALFAIKEAVSKALGVGYIYLSQEGIDPRDIMISIDKETNDYHVALSGKALQIAAQLGIIKWHCSTSITHREIIAVVIGQ